MPSLAELSRSFLRPFALSDRPRPHSNCLPPPAALTSYSTAAPRRRSHRRSWQAAFLAAALLLLALPGLMTLLKPSASSGDSERRQLADWPAAPTDWRTLRAWPGAAEGWFKDHLGWRPRLLSLAADLRLGLREPGPTNVVFGRDDWLFLRGSARLRLALGSLPAGGAVPDAVLPLFTQWIAVIRAAGASPLILIVPDKETLQAALLPWWARRFDSEPQLDRLLAALRSEVCDCVLDLRAALRAGDGSRALYWPRDTHWTPYGAYLGYRALTERLGPAWPGLTTVEDAAVAWGPASRDQDLWRLLGFTTPLRLTLPDQPAPASPRALVEAEGGEETLLRSHRPDLAGPRLLVIGDSFRHALTPWLAESVGTLASSHLPRPGALARLLAAYPSDLVVIVLVERNLYGKEVLSLAER